MSKIRNGGTIINTDYQFAKLIDGSITKAVIPSSVSSVRAYAFYGCSSLLSVNIPKNVKQIEASAFSNCSNLKDLTFEDNSVISIQGSAFSNCGSLENVEFPIGLLSLESYAFNNCSLLKKITIPETFSTVKTRVFDSCSALSYVFFRGNNPIAMSNQSLITQSNNMKLFDMRYMLSAKDRGTTFGFTADNVYLYINVPDSLYTEFTALPNWSALNLKRWVHSCDVESFEDIQNPIDGDYYSLKGDTNYLNPLGEKQIDIRQYVNGEWVEVDIG